MADELSNAINTVVNNTEINELNIEDKLSNAMNTIMNNKLG